jgi:murein DD-endopeptidase MepM/ murein hydrolase activator NlpD
MFKRLPEDGGPQGQTKLPFYSRGHYMPDGVPVVAWRDGEVVKASRISTGNRIRLDHGKENGRDLWSAYYHLADMQVGIGDKVKAGQRIGTVGHGPEYPLNHLHFEIWKGGTQVDPRPYLVGTQMVSGSSKWRWLAYGGIAVVAGLVVARFIR